MKKRGVPARCLPVAFASSSSVSYSTAAEKSKSRDPGGGSLYPHEVCGNRSGSNTYLLTALLQAQYPGGPFLDLWASHRRSRQHKAESLEHLSKQGRTRPWRTCPDCLSATNPPSSHFKHAMPQEQHFEATAGKPKGTESLIRL